MDDRRSFFVGETVDVLVRVASRDTHAPLTLDDIELIEWSLVGGDPEADVLPEHSWSGPPVDPEAPEEGDQPEGQYLCSIVSTGLTAGTYNLAVQMTLGSDVVIRRDKVVLRAIALTPESEPEP